MLDNANIEESAMIHHSMLSPYYAWYWISQLSQSVWNMFLMITIIIYHNIIYISISMIWLQWLLEIFSIIKLWLLNITAKHQRENSQQPPTAQPLWPPRPAGSRGRSRRGQLLSQEAIQVTAELRISGSRLPPRRSAEPYHPMEAHPFPAIRHHTCPKSLSHGSFLQDYG